MKRLNLLLKMCSILLITLIALSCNDDEPVTLDNFDTELNKELIDKLDYPLYLELEGFIFFPSYAVKEHRVIVSKEMFYLPITATLTQISNQDYIMNAEVVFIDTMTYAFDVKITPSGIVSFTWPETHMINGVETDRDISDIILNHDGAIKFGPVVEKFKGNFDGSKFYAKSHFMMKQVQPGELPFYSQLPLIDGPIMLDFAIFELVVQ